MFTIDAEGGVSVSVLNTPSEFVDSGAEAAFSSKRGLTDVIQLHAGEWAVKLWNHLPGVVPITTPKFRNKSTAVERIWKKLAELYPDAIVAEERPKEENARAKRTPRKTEAAATKSVKGTKKTVAKTTWAEELTGELRKRFKPGQDFTLPDVYKLIPAFQRRHKGNQHIAARLRTTLAQDLRGNGIVKTLGKGKYRLV